MAKKIPQRAEGWKFAGAAGRFTVWHAGKNDYRISDGADGEVIAHRQQFGEAHSVARHQADIAKRAEMGAAEFFSEARRLGCKLSDKDCAMLASAPDIVA